jgi:aarF domain-containing kinase
MRTSGVLMLATGVTTVAVLHAASKPPSQIGSLIPEPLPIQEELKDRLPCVLLESDPLVQNDRAVVRFSAWRRFGRFCHLALIALPVVLTVPLWLLPWCATQRLWYRVVLWAIRQAGSAFIKLGQWASERNDFLPAEFCQVMGALRQNAPRHRIAASRAAIDRVLREAQAAAPDADMELVWCDPEPIASGCIAQVHRGLLRVRLNPPPPPPHPNDLDPQPWLQSAQSDGTLYGDPFSSVLVLPIVDTVVSAPPVPAVMPSEVLLPVALKIRHPFVETTLPLDMELMFLWAGRVAKLPGAGWLRAPLVLEEFASALSAQLDLSVEAANLQRFRASFSSRARLGAVFPAPIIGAQGLLIETWEEGDSMQHYLDHRALADALPGGAPALAAQGFHVFVTMLLLDNFLHTDPHAGNMFVRPRPGQNSALVVLDAGLTASLSARGRSAMLSLLRDVLMADGNHAADSILAMARPAGATPTVKLGATHAVVPSQEGSVAREVATASAASAAAAAATTASAGSSFDSVRFREEMQALFRERCGRVTYFDPRTGVIRSRTPSGEPLNVGALITDIMMLVRRFDIQLEETDFAKVVIAVGVLEGIGRQLDPKLDLVPLLAPYLLREVAREGKFRGWLRTAFQVLRSGFQSQQETAV